MPKPHKIKYSKDLQWLSPFVDSVHHLVPIHVLDKVKSFRVPVGKIEQTDASIVLLHGRYNMTVRAYSQYGKIHKANTVEHVLICVAHELAHIVHFHNHGQEFAELMSLIFSIFVSNLRTYGIPDIQIIHTKVKIS